MQLLHLPTLRRVVGLLLSRARTNRREGRGHRSLFLVRQIHRVPSLPELWLRDAHWSAAAQPADRMGVNSRLMAPTIIAAARLRRIEGADTSKVLDK